MLVCRCLPWSSWLLVAINKKLLGVSLVSGSNWREAEEVLEREGPSVRKKTPWVFFHWLSVYKKSYTDFTLINIFGIARAGQLHDVLVTES